MSEGRVEKKVVSRSIVIALIAVIVVLIASLGS